MMTTLKEPVLSWETLCNDIVIGLSGSNDKLSFTFESWRQGKKLNTKAAKTFVRLALRATGLKNVHETCSRNTQLILIPDHALAAASGDIQASTKGVIY